MTDHRRLQRTLFRMQADAGFAGAVLAGDRAALASTGLGEEDVALLAGIDPAALRADPGGKRRAQIAGNATSEFLLTLAAAAAVGEESLLDAFLVSPELHDAIASEGRLPLAFGDFALRRARERDDPPLAAVAELEAAMARLRRDARPSPVLRETPIPSPHPPGDRARAGTVAEETGISPAPGPGEIRLAPSARVLDLPGGTLAWSEALRAALDAALDAGRAAPAPRISADARELVLLYVRGRTSPHRLADVMVERLEPPAGELLLRARRPLSRAERARFARQHGAAPEDLEAFLASFVEEGVLVSG